jgi:hypothetical protein
MISKEKTINDFRRKKNSYIKGTAIYQRSLPTRPTQQYPS